MDQQHDYLAQQFETASQSEAIDHLQKQAYRVLLSGDVATMSDHLRAIEDASRVPGVRRVASEIKSPNTLADQEIYSEQHAKSGPQKAGSRCCITPRPRKRFDHEDGDRHRQAVQA